MSGLDTTNASLGDAQLPPQLAERLSEETQRFHHGTSVEDDLAQASARHDALLQSKVSAAHAEFQHAKDVAHQHGPSDPANNVPREQQPAHATHGERDPVEALEEGVETNAVAAQRAELSDLDARLRRADEVEQRLRAALGESV